MRGSQFQNLFLKAEMKGFANEWDVDSGSFLPLGPSVSQLQKPGEESDKFFPA